MMHEALRVLYLATYDSVNDDHNVCGWHIHQVSPRVRITRNLFPGDAVVNDSIP